MNLWDSSDALEGNRGFVGTTSRIPDYNFRLLIEWVLVELSADEF